MKTWCKYNKREDKDENEKLSLTKLALVNEFYK